MPSTRSATSERPEQNRQQLEPSSENDFAANILVLRAGSVGFTQVEPSGSKSSGVEYASFANEEKDRNPPFGFEKEDGPLGTTLERKRSPLGTSFTPTRDDYSLRAIGRFPIGI
ncbi:hypothetical protein T12_663 [Trichinella patagoniensis]|uniref:Uncharacterized protein n=1 Tax=Trichinella patagoniensis TaxID=990121 RepID=A0A0V0ZCU9_9BILA|nr:hypothetical protein T12_663 [Trichinella patagoniensis]